MKKSLVLVFLVFILVVTVSSSCFAAMDEKETAEIALTIDMKMKEIIASAEALDVDRTFADFSRDKNAVFFFNDKAYSLTALLGIFKEMYGNMKSQKMDFVYSKVVVLGPDSAAWIAYGKDMSESKKGTISKENLTETWIWQKIEGKWVVTHSQESATQTL